MHRRMYGWRGIVMLIPGILLLGGCSNDPVSLARPVVVPADILLMIEANPRGIVLAVGDTQQLTVQARNILGNSMPINDSVPVTYTSANASRVAVSPTGLVKAISVTQSATAAPAPVRIIVRWEHAFITRVDTVYIIVTLPPVHPIVAMSIQPSPYPKDSTWVGLFGLGKTLAVKGMTASGDSVVNLYAYLYTDRRRRTLNEWVTPATRNIAANTQGVFWVYATASVYGVAFQDSVRFTTLDAVHNLALPYKFILNSTGAITTLSANGVTWFFSPCAAVYFLNNTTVPLTITFDNPSQTGVCVSSDQTGNIALTAMGTAGATAIRKFPAAGVVTWTATRTDGVPLESPLTGKIATRDRAYWNTLP